MKRRMGLGPVDPSNPNFPLMLNIINGGKSSRGGSNEPRTTGGCGCFAIGLLVAIAATIFIVAIVRGCGR